MKINGIKTINKEVEFEELVSHIGQEGGGVIE